MTRVGLLLGSQRAGLDPHGLFEAVAAEAAVAVAGGLDLLVAPEHLDAHPYAMLRPWPLLAALRARLDAFDAVGSVVAGLTSQTQLTGDMTTVAAIGTGAVGVALAAGYRREDFAAAGRDYDDRYRAREKLRSAISGGDLVWSAAGTTTAAARAARDGVRWYAPATCSEEGLGSLAAVSEEPGVIRCDVLLSDDEDPAGRWARFVAPKYDALGSWGFTDSSAGVLAGPADSVAEALARRARAAGADTLVVRLSWPDMTAAEGLTHVAAFARDVMPLLTRELTTTSSPGRH